MAKKKKQQQPKAQQTSNMITNLPMKGMVKDIDSSYVDKQNWSHARNAINNSVDGDTGVIGNEPANLLCAEIPYTVIGGIHLYGDKWIIFSTDNDGEFNDKSSEIGEFDDSTCTYTTLINDFCLNFHKDNLIIGVAKENFDCGWQIYWDDGRNPSRTIPLDKIPWKQYQTSMQGVDCVTYANVDPLQLDCEKIRLAPLLDSPTLTLSKAAEGGQLPNGMYQVFIAYSHNDQIIGDYLGVSNPQPLWSYENNSGSLDLRISNLDKEFEWMQVVVRTRVHNGYSSYILGYYSTETSQINIDYLDPDLEKVRSSRLLLRNPAYEKSEGMFEVNDYLIRTQPTEQFDFNYQPLANEIVTEWTSAKYPANYYKNGGNKPTFLRDEVYTFFIRFIYNTGEKSKAYHIPGREAEINTTLGTSEDSLDITINNFNNAENVFKVHNTASYSGTLTGSTGDGGEFVSYGKMGYWEAKTERYPATDSLRWGSLCGKLIRHHKIPDENTHTTTRLSDGTWELHGGNVADSIYVIGAQFSNISPPVDNQGAIIQNIRGYEILVGNRDGNKSIIAKGIIRNMMSYERNEHQRSLDEANWQFPDGEALNNFIGPMAARSYDLTTTTYTPLGQSDINFGLMPNYPYNDTQSDPFLNHRGNGDVDPVTSPWFAGMLGGAPVENNWITGQGSLLGKWGNENQSIHYSAEMSLNSGESRALNEFTRNYHTFHSPDLNFTHMYLAPSELVVYKTLTGIQTGQFIKSEKHPGAKLLKNKAVLIAAIIGVGYALNKMRGKRNVKINTAKSQSTGETMAVGSGMTPMPGTGTAAAAVNVLLSIPGTVIGAVSEIAFNTVVDVASVFGAGKLARQIGAPVYQMIESGTTGLMAGHIGPNKTIEYQGSDFTSVPTLFSMVTGILSFLNYVAIGGDKIIDLILALVDFQDHAYKYNSHGFYSQYNPFISGGQVGDLGTTSIDGVTTTQGTASLAFRHEVDRARYIKQGINYFDGSIPVNNLHRPSTVVVKTASNIDSPSNHGYIDNSKFTIGGGKCAGVYNYTPATGDPGVTDPSRTLSWWSPTGTVSTSIAAQYVGLKVDNDNQYGQLDSILFTPISQPFRFLDAPGIFQQEDITNATRFYTGPLFGGDTYISRYTEKVTMPFWFDFMKDGPDGLPFDYRFYSNIPFPRYWMNTEKYRMDEFVRPIKNLTFDFSEAYPTDMYHLDSPTLVDCEAINSEYISFNSGNQTSNYNEDLNFHLEVVSVPASGNIMSTLDNRSKASHWEIAGVAKSQFIEHAAEDVSWYTGTSGQAPLDADGLPVYEPKREREVACGIQGRHISHNHPTPLIDWDGGGCISSGKDDWYDFCNPGDDVSPPRKTDIDGVSRAFKALYNWNTGQFVRPVLWRTPSGVIGDPNWNTNNPCHHNGLCYLLGSQEPKGTTLKQCTQKAGGTLNAVPGGFSLALDLTATGAGASSFWIDSCWPADDPQDFRYYSSKQKKKEKGWFSGTIVLDQGSFNVGGSSNVTSPTGGSVSIGGDSDCDGSGTKFKRPGNPDRNGAFVASYNRSGGGLDPDGGYNNTVHVLIAKGGAPPKAGDIGGTDDKYSDEFEDEYDDNATNPKKKRGGMFVETQGFMYTHISGVNDFYVESDMNLAFRDWEDVPRKRHYDNEEFTDVNLMFHVDHIQSDNYYKYDQSLNMRRLWTASFGQIQPRWYDPYVSETCFINYPKRLLYSMPSVGAHTKEMQQFKRDEIADHWRTFLPENFRDFKSTVNTIVPTDKTGAMILFPTLSPQLFQGVDQLQLAKSGNKLVIGDGGLFSQAFQNVTNSNVSHEYGSSESSRGVVSTPSGIFFVSQAQGKIFQYGGKGLKAISDSGMKWWFNKYLPSQLLKDFPLAENHPEIIDNPVVSAGVLAIYDPNNDLLYFSKRDYKAHADKVDDIQLLSDGRFMYSNAAGAGANPNSETPAAAGGGSGNGQSVEIDVNDTDYFEDVSWTVSYDPKAGAWISFHDWHPELAFNSINHFLTTKKGVSATPICPPDYTYNGTTGECEINAQGSEPAQLINDVILATNNSVSQPATNASDIQPSTNTWVAGGTCVIDIVVSMDWSGSTGGAKRTAQQSWLTSFINNADIQAGLTNGDIQMGFCGWASGGAELKSWDETGGTGSSTYSMDNQITAAGVKSWYDAQWCSGGCGTNILEGLTEGNSLLIDKGTSRLGDRTSQTGYKEVLILITDTGSGASAPFPQFQAVGIGTGTNTRVGREVHALYCGASSPNPPDPDILDYISCTNGPVNSDPYQHGIAGNGSAASWQGIADALTGNICQPIGDCTCPSGYTLATNIPCALGSTPDCIKEGPCTCPSGFTLAAGACDNTNTPDCVSNECECPTAVPAYNLVGTCDASSNPTCERTICSCQHTPGYGTASNWETGTCGSQGDPLMCNYDFSDSVAPNYDIVGIWRHNARTDKFANFYGNDYPWEVDILETSGQQVTTLRSIEYILESYVYKNDGRDRFHVLDFNFDEAEIYNSEQTSGLLKLNISPKNNAPLITTYPIINASDIDILYSKEEQKYRFNQFWDVTLDRGEFTGIENTIYITRLNGYIKDLNAANIDLMKSSFERKKFRHYYNHLILRRTISDNKKMLLRLNNTKLNMSTR